YYSIPRNCHSTSRPGPGRRLARGVRPARVSPRLPHHDHATHEGMHRADVVVGPRMMKRHSELLAVVQCRRAERLGPVRALDGVHVVILVDPDYRAAFRYRQGAWLE